MSYEVKPLDVVASEKVIDPRSKKGKEEGTPFAWWNAQTDSELVSQVLSTSEYLKRTNIQRVRQASIYARLFSGKPLYNFLAANSTLDSSNQLPMGRPTANVVYSCIDTLVSRLTQNKPKPVFLTDNGHYKERKLAKEANAFISGELYRTKAYALGATAFRDACVLGDGFIKVMPRHNKVHLERVVGIELNTDFNDGYYRNPRQLEQKKLIDRGVIMEEFQNKEEVIDGAQSSNVDSSPRSTETISDQIITSEMWHLPSGPGANDGRHVIVCAGGVILDESWSKKSFPFVNFGYNPNMVGFFSQGLAEILMPTQMEIYRMLIIASQAIELMGVPRIYIDEMSKIMETSFNNRIGTIIKGRGNPPEFINATANSPEIYQWIQWLIANAYQMAGISQMAASGVKPAGLNSGEAQREFLQTQDERFSALETRYAECYPELSYLMIDCAKDIADETGSYTTVYPGKDGTREVDFKNIKKLKDTYVIQCFEESSLPKDPAGRQAKLSEMLAAQEITKEEFRRLSNFPDLEQDDRLASALEERILMCLDEIIDNGDKNYADIQPNSFLLDPTDMATTKAVQYINMYAGQKLEPEKMDTLRTWWTQVQALKQAAMPPPTMEPQAAPSAGPVPIAPPNPSIAPTSAAQV
jgi:hypothetical protein